MVNAVSQCCAPAENDSWPGDAASAASTDGLRRAAIVLRRMHIPEEIAKLCRKARVASLYADSSHAGARAVCRTGIFSILKDEMVRTASTENVMPRPLPQREQLLSFVSRSAGPPRPRPRRNLPYLFPSRTSSKPPRCALGDNCTRTPPSAPIL